MVKKFIDKELQVEIFSPEDNVDKLIAENSTLTTCPKKKLEEFYFDSVKYLTCINEKEKTKIPKKLKEEILYLLLSMKEMEHTHAFYYFEDQKIVVYLDKDVDLEQRYYVNFEDIADDDEPDESYQSYAESYFGGEAITEIEDTPAEIKKNYGRSYTKEIIIGAVMFLLLATMGGYLYKDLTKVNTSVASKPIVNPLTDREKFVILNSLSTALVEEVLEEVKKYAKNDLLLDEQRISNFAVFDFTELPRIEPQYNKEENSWSYASPHDEKFAKGGYSAEAILTYQSVYPAVGYKLESEKERIWKKQVSVKRELAISDISQENKKRNYVINEKCLAQTLYLTDRLLPTKRGDNSIEILIKNVSPSNLVSKSLKLLKECPVYLSNFSLLNGKFSMKATLKNLDKKKMENANANDNNSSGLKVFPNKMEDIHQGKIPEIIFIEEE